MNIQFEEISLTHVHPLFAIWNNKDAIKFTYHTYVGTIEECKNKITETLNYYKSLDFHFGPFVIIMDNKVIGLIGLECRAAESKEYELWYILSSDYWGKGFATISIKQFIKKAFNEMNINRLYAEVVTENTASCKVLEKNGFIKEGCLRSKFYKNGTVKDLFIYSILKNEIQ